MGTDREARALGAGESIEVDGKILSLKPVNVRKLCELEREALRYYKRQYLETYRDNIDLLPSMEQAGLMRGKLDEVANLDVSRLPEKVVYDASGVPLKDEVRAWVQSNYDMDSSTDLVCYVVLSMALEAGKITPDELKEMSGSYPVKGNVRYDQWWITGCTEGMARFVCCALGEDVSFEEVSDWPLKRLMEASQLVERITVAQVKNG